MAAPDLGIDQARRALAAQRHRDLLAGLYVHSQQPGLGIGADMRGADRIGQAEERVVSPRRLRIEDIQFPETRDYVHDVVAKRDDYAKHYKSELGL